MCCRRGRGCSRIRICSPDDITPATPEPCGGPIRIAHAPTHFGAKGTSFVLAAIAELRAAGVAFEFDLIQGVSHDEAIARIAQCDLFIDQLLAGWYGGAAVEAMMLGKARHCLYPRQRLRLGPAGFPPRFADHVGDPGHARRGAARPPCTRSRLSAPTRSGEPPLRGTLSRPGRCRAAGHGCSRSCGMSAR